MDHDTNGVSSLSYLPENVKIKKEFSYTYVFVSFSMCSRHNTFPSHLRIRR